MNITTACAVTLLSALLGAACDGGPSEPPPPVGATWARIEDCAEGRDAVRVPVVHQVRIPAERADSEGLAAGCARAHPG